MRRIPGILCLMVLLSLQLLAHAPSGAIFTTDSTGSEVNLNQFPSKEAVYLDGGPGPGAPATAAGLDDGTYVFQVTNPNGKVLLSTDRAECRQFTVSGGVITGVVMTADGCQHATGTDQDHNAITVQLFPFDDTTNPGGVYKVWVTRVEDFLAACTELGVPNGLAVVDCGFDVPKNAHGFVPSHSKTDNFKVKPSVPIEIDTRFFPDFDGDGHQGSDEPFIDGLQITWIDTLGASNNKSSYYNPELLAFHEAHVEAVENGTHRVVVGNQPGCTVGTIHAEGVHLPEEGPQIVEIVVKGSQNQEHTYRVDVACRQ